MLIFCHHYFVLFEKGKEIKTRKNDAPFSEIIIHTTVDLIEKWLSFTEENVGLWLEFALFQSS